MIIWQTGSGGKGRGRGMYLREREQVCAVDGGKGEGFCLCRLGLAQDDVDILRRLGRRGDVHKLLVEQPCVCDLPGAWVDGDDPAPAFSAHERDKTSPHRHRAYPQSPLPPHPTPDPTPDNTHSHT